MHVLVIASRKGGAGKTTLAGHLAVEAERAGAGQVAVIDTDLQGSLADWWNARAAPTPLFVQTRPSPHDLRSIGATVELVEHLGKPLLFILNGATPRARITAEAIAVLSQHGLLAPSIIHQRVDFAASMVDGRTVMEMPGESRSAEEIGRLWAYIDERVTGRRPALQRGALTLVPALPRQEVLPLGTDRQEVA